MSDEWQVHSDADHVSSYTEHTHPTGVSLSVQHIPDPRAHGYSEPSTHQVTIDSGPYFTEQSGHMSWPTRQHGAEKAYLGFGRYGPPPSAELRTLIENHHKDHAWMPLLDRLAEEYPELNAAVTAHTAARVT